MNKAEEIQDLIDIVERLADKELQEKGWFRNIEGVYVSYFETVPHFLDTAPDILKTLHKGSLTQEQEKLLGKLTIMVEEYDIKVYENYQSLENSTEKVFNLILSDPEWHEIRETAQQFLSTFR